MILEQSYLSCLAHDRETKSITNLLLDGTPIDELIMETRVDNLWVVPADTALAGVEQMLADRIVRETILREAFDSIDASGVGELVRLGAERGRAAKPGLKLGVCGEHGGDLASIKVFYEAGIDYVSCSPFRVPIARLAAAQAALNHG